MRFRRRAASRADRWHVSNSGTNAIARNRQWPTLERLRALGDPGPARPATAARPESRSQSGFRRLGLDSQDIGAATWECASEPPAQTDRVDTEMNLPEQERDE
jgi:hypothetical protein